MGFKLLALALAYDKIQVPHIFVIIIVCVILINFEIGFN